MTLTSMGRVNVTTPGTQVRLSTDDQLRASKLFIQCVPGLTGKIYFGKVGMNKTTLAGVVRVMVPGTSTAPDQFFLQSPEGGNPFNVSEYAVDADVAGEGPLVSYWIA